MKGLEQSIIHLRQYAEALRAEADRVEVFIDSFSNGPGLVSPEATEGQKPDKPAVKRQANPEKAEAPANIGSFRNEILTGVMSVLSGAPEGLAPQDIFDRAKYDMPTKVTLKRLQGWLRSESQRGTFVAVKVGPRRNLYKLPDTEENKAEEEDKQSE